MTVDPIQALRAGARQAAPGAARPHLIVAGGTGALGNEVLRTLVGTQRFGAVHVLAREAMRAGMKGVHAVTVSGAPAAWPQLPASTGVVMFDPPRLYYDRERALWTPQPADLLAVAQWMRAGGATTLAVVLPHAQGRLPEALKRGLASLDEHAVAALGFERLLFIRSAQKPGTPPAGRPFLERTAAWLLSVFRFMVPTSEQPVRASKVAQLLDAALQAAPPGIHVAPPALVWQASQGDLRGVVAQWLGGHSAQPQG
jgi:hypothetical protein